jgi:uncharacterized membrane protein YfcA
MHRSAWTTVAGAAAGAVAGLFLGALMALLASAAIIFLGFGTNAPAGWATVLIQPAVFWIVAGGLGGALIGRRIARRIASQTLEPPPPPV